MPTYLTPSVIAIGKLMQFCSTRRSFLATSSVIAATATAPVFAAGQGSVKERANRLVEGSMVINGNMLPRFSDPVDDPKFVDYGSKAERRRR